MTLRRTGLLFVAAALAALAVCVGPAQAAFPGTNGEKPRVLGALAAESRRRDLLSVGAGSSTAAIGAAGRPATLNSERTSEVLQ